MKLSKYVALAKRGYCKVIHVQGSGIWLGLKCAIYRAVELPDIHGEGQARAVLDIPEKAWGNTFFEEENAEGEHDICGFDMTGGAWELPAEELELQVNYKGVQATALRCTNGELLFYDSRLAAPVSDVMRDSEYVQTVIRKRRSGQRVIVIKDGFEAIAAIMPMKVINSAFLKALSELDSACVEQYERESKAAWRRKRSRKMDKDQVAIARIIRASEIAQARGMGPLYVGYSGGKDSTVLADLAIRAGVPIEIAHSHTTIDAPETVYFVRREMARFEACGNAKCTVHMPRYKGKPISMWTLIPQKLMPPTRVVRYCTSVLKQSHSAGRFSLTGVRWDESVRRKKNTRYI